MENNNSINEVKQQGKNFLKIVMEKITEIGDKYKNIYSYILLVLTALCSIFALLSTISIISLALKSDSISNWDQILTGFNSLISFVSNLRWLYDLTYLTIIAFIVFVLYKGKNSLKKGLVTISILTGIISTIIHGNFIRRFIRPILSLKKDLFLSFLNTDTSNMYEFSRVPGFVHLLLLVSFVAFLLSAVVLFLEIKNNKTISADEFKDSLKEAIPNDIKEKTEKVLESTKTKISDISKDISDKLENKK